VLARVKVVVTTAEARSAAWLPARRCAPARPLKSGQRGGWLTGGEQSRTLCAPASVAQSGLNHGFGLGIERAGGFVEIRMRGSATAREQWKVSGAVRLKASHHAHPLPCRSLPGSAPQTRPRAKCGKAKRNCSSVASGRENRMFSRMVPSKRNDSLQGPRLTGSDRCSGFHTRKHELVHSRHIIVTVNHRYGCARAPSDGLLSKTKQMRSHRRGKEKRRRESQSRVGPACWVDRSR